MRDFSPNQLKYQRQKTAFLIIDIQERLIGAMNQARWHEVEANILNLIHLSQLYQIPLVVTEQYPQGLGPTVTSLATALGDVPRLSKVEFSACSAEGFSDLLQERGVEDDYTLVVTGIETHICVYQTVLDLLDQGYGVHIPRDCVMSRKESDWETGLELMASAGGVITSSETVIFQVLKKAGTSAFKAMNKRLKLKKGSE